MSKQIFEKYFQQLKQDLLQSYESSGLKAHGTWGRSLRVETTEKRGTIFGTHYSKYMTEGREPTKRSQGNILLKIIEDWVRVKPGLPPEGWTLKDFAYVVTQKIHKSGIEVPNKFNPGNVITTPIEHFERQRLNKLLSEITAEYQRIITKNITDPLQSKNV